MLFSVREREDVELERERENETRKSSEGGGKEIVIKRLEISQEITVKTTTKKKEREMETLDFSLSQK